MTPKQTQTDRNNVNPEGKVKSQKYFVLLCFHTKSHNFLKSFTNLTIEFKKERNFFLIKKLSHFLQDFLQIFCLRYCASSLDKMKQNPNINKVLSKVTQSCKTPLE
jgi:hypothetical protein